MEPKQTGKVENVIPVIAEEAVAGKKTVRTGAVRVHKRVRNRTQRVEMSLMRETVDVSRVPINKVVKFAPETRVEGATTIIPVVEEELVITKRLVLKEEIHLTRRRTVSDRSENVTVGREEVEIERVDAEGRRVAGRAGKPPFGRA